MEGLIARSIKESKYQITVIAEYLERLLAENFKEMPDIWDALMAAINTVAQGVVSRVAEGSANAFLLTRLRAATIRYLRPLS